MNRNMEDIISIQQSELQKTIMWRFDVARKVMDLNNEIKKPGSAGFKDSHWIGQFNKIVYGRESIQKTWEVLFDTFQEARPGLSEKIRKSYPTLTDTEFCVCILTYAGFGVNEAALILNLSPHTVQSRRGSIRQKMNLGRGEDIAAHIDKL